MDNMLKNILRLALKFLYDQIFLMENYLNNWTINDGVTFFKKIGIKNGQIVLDFGCGKGNNTLPIARILGEKGLIYSLDKDKPSLEELTKRAKIEKLNNIKTIHSKYKIKIPLANNYLDATILYDVIHPYYFSDAERKELLSEVHRILKKEGFISVYPHHMELEYVKNEIEKTNFKFENEYSATIIHDDKPIKDKVFNFCKTKR